MLEAEEDVLVVVNVKAVLLDVAELDMVFVLVEDVRTLVDVKVAAAEVETVLGAAVVATLLELADKVGVDDVLDTEKLLLVEVAAAAAAVTVVTFAPHTPLLVLAALICDFM